MSSDRSDRFDEHLQWWLAGYLEVEGHASKVSPDDIPPDDAQLTQRLRRAVHCLRLAEHVWGDRDDDQPNHEAPTWGADGSSDMPNSDQSLHLSLDTDQDNVRHFGRYRILRRLGIGGSAMVYEALDPKLSRKVALKIPRPHTLSTPELRRRFVQEARLAASLDHPHLVSVYEAGEIGPTCYIASAYSDGLTLADWLQQQTEPVPLRTAARLIRCLAEVVHYVHNQGILHRDLKPSNVMVEIDHNEHPPKLFPKLTDFGLAKMVAGCDQHTRQGAVIGTPLYMAPEQAEGRFGEMGPHTDVYSLGAILYELLTGQPPFRGPNDLSTLLRVLSQDPVPPTELRPEVPRDLEAICLKTLEREPRQRYQSASELSQDLWRFLHHRPVHARPVGILGRFWKHCCRRPLETGLAVALTLAVLTGLGISTWQWSRAERLLVTATHHRQQAERNFNTAHRAVNDLFNFSDEFLFDAPGMTPVRSRMQQTALAYYEGFVEHSQGNRPELLDDLATAWLRIGQIREASGDTASAKEAFEKSLAIREDLVQRFPEDSDQKAAMARCYYALGSLQCELGDPDRGEELLVVARRIREDLAEQYPVNATYLVELATSYNRLGLKCTGEDRFEEAVGYHRQVCRILLPLLNTKNTDVTVRKELALAYNRMGIAYSFWGKPEDATANEQRALELYDQLAAEYPLVNGFRRGQASCCFFLGGLYAKSDPDKCLVYLNQAADIQRRLVRENPASLAYRADLAFTLLDAGDAHRQLDQPAEALECYDESQEILAQLVEAAPQVLRYRKSLALTWHHIGALQAAEAHSDLAIEAFREAHEQFEILVQAAPGTESYRDYMARNLVSIALRQTAEQQHDLAADSFQKAIAIFERLAASAPEGSRLHQRLANARVLAAANEKARQKQSDSRASELP